jgi:hypothetical protein
MRVSRNELRFDFGGARFRLPRDRELLGWIVDQFLYGEVTGIQVGHWLYAAPSLEAAAFFARQAAEELAHVRVFLRVHALLGTQPGPAHPAVRFLSTGAMGTDYAEHVATEMAVGEGQVLAVFQALIDTVDSPEIVHLLEAAARQEERHVAFGEAETARLVQERRGLASDLLGANLLTLLALPRLARYIQRRLPADHEVLRHTEAFLHHVVRLTELRLQRLGVLQGRLAEIGWGRRAWLITRAFVRHQLHRFRRPRRLTDTYLEDPQVTAARTESGK